MTSRHGNDPVQPGVKVFLWPTAFHHVIGDAVARAFDEGALNVAYRNGITTHETTVTNTVQPSLWLTMNQGDMTLTISNVDVSVRHQKRHNNQFEEDFIKRVSGTFWITIDILHPDALHDPIYDVEIYYVDVLFNITSNQVQGFGGGGVTIYNGAVFSNNVHIFGGGTMSVIQFGGQNHHLEFYQEDATAADDDEDEDDVRQPKRSRHAAPIVLSGMNRSVRSADDCASITCSGINSRVFSTGRDVEIRASGVNPAVASSGANASIRSSGTAGSVDSTGTHARIRSSGSGYTVKSSGPCASIRASGSGYSVNSIGPNASIRSSGSGYTVTSSGPNASIRSSGSGGTVTSSGADASIQSSGSGKTVKSTGDRASISFTGTNTRIQSSGGAVNDDFGRTLIRTVTNAVRDSLNSSQADNSLSRDWAIGDGHLSSTHLVTLQQSEDPLPLPQDINFPDAQYSGHMMTMLISNRVFDAVASIFHVDKSLSCNVTQEDLVFQATQNGQSNSGTARTLSDSLPDFAAKYPGASVEVVISSIEAPTVELSGGENIDVCLWVLAILRARLPGGSTVDFLTIEVNVTSTLLLTMEPGTLKGTVAAIKLKSITVVESLLESVNQLVLKNIFDLISEQFLRRKFEEAAQKGITIPSPLLPGVDAYENVTMTSAGDFIRIDADLKFFP